MERSDFNNVYLMGDIHGWPEAVRECLDAVKFDNERDLLIQIGDLCDRGPDSWDVVEELMKIKNLVCIRGNHDQWLLEFLIGGAVENMWIRQGGRETFDSYERRNWQNDNEHIRFYGKQVPYFVLDNMCFVHGGFDREYPIAEQDQISLCWDREFVKQSMSCTGKQKLKTADGFDQVFIGHTPTLYYKQTKPITRGGVTNVDTGCGKGGQLTIYNICTNEYYQTQLTY